MIASYDRAWAFYEYNRYEEAQAQFQLLLVKHPHRALYWKGLGHTFKMQQKYQEALDAYRIAILLGEKDPLFLIHVAECLRFTEEKPRIQTFLPWIEKKIEKKFLPWLSEIKKVWCS